MVERSERQNERQAKTIAQAPATEHLLDFSHKVVIVTGASGGIGAGIAARFAEAGAAVIVHYNQRQHKAQTVVDAIAAHGGKAVAVQADVTKHADIDHLVTQASEIFGGVDVLINNAGVYPLAAVLDMSEDAWNSVIDVNLSSVHVCTQVVANKMINQGKAGTIVNIASIEGETPAPMHSHYSVAKSCALTYTRAAAFELGPKGIRVNAVSPGLIWRQGLEQDWPDGVRRYREAAPLGRLGRADDVADACLFLASAAARWITGVTLRVDGGVMTHTPY